MKLCKDCKHVAMPNQFANAYAGWPAYAVPMCAHPDAERSPVDGSAVIGCVAARSQGDRKSICGPDAKLFEERPPHVPEECGLESTLNEYQAHMEPGQQPSWWRRVFGG